MGGGKIASDNMCTIRQDDFDLGDGSDEDWTQFFDKYARHSCPTCARKGVLHCPHGESFRGTKPATGESAKAKRDAIKDTLFQRKEREVDLEFERRALERMQRKERL